ncbi:MAG: hypothetical protein IJX28_07460 [Clostridia bacterium]|nr:hypothetical protein [Clostridia bacterium]
MKKQNLKSIIAVLFLFATVFVIASCRTQDQFPAITTRQKTTTTIDNSFEPLSTTKGITYAATDWIGWDLHTSNCMIVQFGRVKEGNMTMFDIPYVPVSMSIVRYFTPTLSHNFLDNRSQWSSNTTLWIPEELAALPLNGTVALISVTKASDSAASERQWSLALNLEEYNDAACAIYFPIKDGLLQGLSSPVTVNAPVKELNSRFYYCVDKGNHIIDKHGLPTPHFADGITIQEIADFYIWTDKNYYP